MSSVDFLFDLIARFSIFAFLLLGAGSIGLRFFQQPLERIRSIQISLPCVFLAAILSQASWKPSIDLPVLPASESSQLAEHSDSHLGEMREPNAVQGIDVRAEPSSGGLTLHQFEEPGSASEAAAINVLTPAVRPWGWLRLAKLAIVVGFLGLSVLQIAYLALGHAAARRLIAKSKPLSESVDMRVRQMFATLSDRTDIRFATSTEIQVPMVNGVVKPTVLLPANLADEDADLLLLRHILAHEWKHIDRKDLVTWQLVTLCQVFLWPQPFYWVLRRELRVSQDQIADEFAAQQTGQQAAYAETLVRFARSRPVVMLGALTMAGTKSNLFRRVEMLLNDNFHVSAFARWRVILGFATAMTVAGVMLASLQLTQAVASGNQPENENKAAESDTNDNKQVEAPESVRHLGFVFDAKTDKPIEGATVIVTRMNSSDWRELEVTESTTDADGKYTFTIPSDQLKQRLLYIMFDLRHPGHAPRHCGSYSYGMIKKNLELGSEPWFTKLKMVPGSKVSGRLVDEGGKPVAGAQLRGRSSDPSAGNRVGSSWIEAVSDEDGRFEIQVTRDGTAGLSIVPLDHCMKHIDIGSNRGDLGDIALSPGLSIRGRVVDATGKPLEGLWANLTRADPERRASYEMKRSSKSDDHGEFRTRPLSPGEYSVEIETKATGAIEKAKYANFHKDPPPAMFVKQVIEVDEGIDKPFVIQAVPHVLISGQCYDSAGEKRAFHSPYLTGRLNDQPVWIREGRSPSKGAFEMMVPHGIKNVRLNFTTNEHSALTVQFDDKPGVPQRNFRFETIEEDIKGIKIVRYVAPILQAKVVDESGDEVQGATVRVTYTVDRTAAGAMYGMTSHFEQQSSGLYQSSSLAPGFEFDVFAAKDGLESDRTKLTMKEGENKVITLMLKAKPPAESGGNPLE